MIKNSNDKQCFWRYCRRVSSILHVETLESWEGINEVPAHINSPPNAL